MSQNSTGNVVHVFTIEFTSLTKKHVECCMLALNNTKKLQLITPILRSLHQLSVNQVLKGHFNHSIPDSKPLSTCIYLSKLNLYIFGGLVISLLLQFTVSVIQYSHSGRGNRGELIKMVGNWYLILIITILRFVQQLNAGYQEPLPWGHQVKIPSHTNCNEIKHFPLETM